ncbi:hypothetical protein [Nocardioides aurantiacus]|uniref:Uncharacterized protein n=1 Tax=Nocardioides aurantiacus TaxID=86796 RepID=A0A3N2CW01_9ACTN|nr:hypothetical protein [Nocardioides aurantiacus]ROR91720.1 hypothetical protein EDD33_2595 [Nocardioides aurantiacus]
MNILEARAAIEAILAAIPDKELPKFDRREVQADGRVLVWWGGTGHYLGSATTDGERDPLAYRRSASWSAIEGEMTCRADAKHLKRERAGRAKQVSA